MGLQEYHGVHRAGSGEGGGLIRPVPLCLPDALFSIHSTMASYFPPSGTIPSHSSTRSPSPADLPLSPPVQRSNALSNRITSVLSASYADSDLRDALETLSLRGIHNTAETRRQLRLDVQKEVIDCNAEIVRDFGKVAEVSFAVARWRNHELTYISCSN